ncbi:hypothetical protein COO60DRAFT_1022916 [Scenedesmus sp. NREL 46B-D3]|nr:hypothetical protein COO60DRAFT_1022916 [Scenedesmus sp. NREL 46B-D3]
MLQVLAGLDDLLQRQKLQMRTEEAQQLRQFRSLLADIEGQLQASKQAAAAHQGDWMGKTVALREELAQSQEIAGKLDAMAKLAEEEAARCRVQFRAQEDDRQHLVRQLIAVKQDNSRLKQEQSALQEELDAITALALEAEAGRPTGTADHQWSSTALHAAGARPSTSDSSLAAAITDMVSKRGSGSSSMQVAGSAGGRARPMTAGCGRQRSQPAVQRTRPWSAAAQQQHGCVQSNVEPPENGVVGDPTALQAKMERYSHVIQQLKKLLESERRQLRQARSCYTAELGRRTELQGLLLSSIQRAKQQHRAAEAAVNAQQRQQSQQSQPLPWADERPRSTAARSRPVSGRLMTGHSGVGAAVGGSQLLGSGSPHSCNRPSSVVQAADGQQPQLDEPAWEQLLEQLLVRRDVLELLFGRAFPDLAEAPQGQLAGSRAEPEAAQLFERWAACQQQRQQERPQQEQPQLQCAPRQQAPQQCGLGEASPLDADLSGVALDEGALESSDSDGGDSSTGMSSGAHEAAAEAVMHATGAGVDDSFAWREQQQREARMSEQQPAEDAHATLGGPSAHVMPRFPARQPLHHTVVWRPRSGLVQQQAGTGGATRRPASAAAGSQAVQLRCLQGLARPATAACRQAEALGQQQQPQLRLLDRSVAARTAVMTGARPGSSSSSSSIKGGGTLQAGRPLSAVSQHVWAADAAVIAGSFLASS